MCSPEPVQQWPVSPIVNCIDPAWNPCLRGGRECFVRKVVSMKCLRIEMYNMFIQNYQVIKTLPVTCFINPRTDGGPGHLSTDGGGADNRPPEISKTKQVRDTR